MILIWHRWRHPHPNSLIRRDQGSPGVDSGDLFEKRYLTDWDSPERKLPSDRWRTRQSLCRTHQPSRTSGQPRMLLYCTAGRLPSAVFTPQTQSMSVPLLQQLPPLRGRPKKGPLKRLTELRPAVTTTLGPSAILSPPGLLLWATA